MNPSTAQARVVVDELIRNGVRHVVLSPGSRNAPLSFALHDAAVAGRITLHVRIDERSAGFLALGIAARRNRPVAVTCTSGTAATNLHPAVAEADRAGVPLVVLTADRPPEARASGASQSIEQAGLYGRAVRRFEELAVAERRAEQNVYWRTQVCRMVATARGRWRGGPVHLNIPFREPLVPERGGDWSEELSGREHGGPWLELSDQGASPGVVEPTARRGLVLVADGPSEQARDWARRHGWPLVAETGAVGVDGLTAGMWLLGTEAFMAEHRPEQVVCFGRPTVFRQVRRLLGARDVDVLLVHGESVDWPGCADGLSAVGQMVGEPAKPADAEWLADWRAADLRVRRAVGQWLDSRAWPSGMGVARNLLGAMPVGALLVVGASNPTRDIALAAVARPDVLVHRNRGVAGIDGTVSTAIGAALVHNGPSYALLGDLTFLHDSNGLLMGPGELRPDLTIVVFNDDGGGIFALLEQGAPEHGEVFERVFGTPHGTDLGALCAAHGVGYQRVDSASALTAAVSGGAGLRVVEVSARRDGLRAEHEALRAVAARAATAG